MIPPEQYISIEGELVSLDEFFAQAAAKTRISGASAPKPRGRPLAPGTVALMDTLQAILAEQHPMSARGAFYAATVAGAVEKTEAGYSKVQRLLVRMREQGRIPWAWISDGTRWRGGVDTFSGVDDALRRTVQLYRRSLWDEADEIVEVWHPKGAGRIPRRTARADAAHRARPRSQAPQ